MTKSSAEPRRDVPAAPQLAAEVRRLRVTNWSSLRVALLVGVGSCSGALERPFAPVAPLEATRALQAELLASRLRCTSCHAFESERIAAESAPSLNDIGARKTPAGLRRWLTRPHAAKPGTAMPDMLAALEDGERERAVDELVHFLSAQGGVLEGVDFTADFAPIERGRQAFHSIGCVACHEPHESPEDLEQPLWSFSSDEMFVRASSHDLGAPALDTTLESLSAFLLDPLAARPSGRMPSLGLSASEAREIALYLLRDQIDASRVATQPGLRWVAHVGRFDSCEPGFGGAEVTAEGIALTLDALPAHGSDRFGLEFSGFLKVEHTGAHTFYSRSDDGSRVYVDGRLVVDNDGDHAPTERSGDIWLERGVHAFDVTFYENEGGEELAVTWKTPRAEKQPIAPELLTHGRVRYDAAKEAFELDARKIERGRVAFESLGCSSCHEIERRETRAPSRRPFASLSAHRTRGCLADSPPREVPQFALDDEQRELLRALVASPQTLREPRDARSNLHSTLTRLDCLACHVRDGVGGPNSARAPYFRPSREVDLGNEGRLPPKLEGVGQKLRREWIERVLTQGATARPYLATRMPSFGARNVATFARAFEQVDLADRSKPEPPFDVSQVEIGRKLAGAKGLGCIQCHLFNGVESLGIPAVDLAFVHERIRADWFERLILDPKSVGMNSRMPELWQTIETSSGSLVRSPVADVFDGDPALQVTALWHYLALGTSMPLPDGLNVSEREYELVPRTEPILCAAFLAGHTPRGMMVGHPEFVHFAFDLEHARPVWAWRGRFFNAQATWHGRAGGLERPPGDDVFEFPSGNAVRSKDGDAPKWLGWKFDAARRPIFMYGVDGVRIEESFEPLLRPSGSTLMRRIVARTEGRTLPPEMSVDFGAGPQMLEFVLENDVWSARISMEVTW